MDISLLSVLRTQVFDFHRQLAGSYANALHNAMTLHISGTDEMKQMQQSYFLSAKRGMEEKLYVGNIRRIENHLYWNDEELADDDQIINVVMMTGPVTRDGGACSYGTKDIRDMVMYANTIQQVVGHVFYINTPGGESSCRNDYEQMIEHCHANGKPTVAFVDGMCASSGVNFASRCDRVIVMNPRDDFGCIGSMAAFWATPDGAIDRDGSRYVEIVGDDCPGKNDWYRNAAQGDYDKLKAQVNKSTQEFHQSVRENRPLTEDWMLTGEVFEAQELIPALVDEIGDFDRAVECVFQLADKTLTPAREATVVEDPDDEPEGKHPEGREPEDGAKVTAVVQQHTEQESINPTNHNNDMTEEEKKAAEVAEQPAATQEEAPATEQPAEEAPATEAPAVSEESPAQEEQPATGEEAPVQEEEPAATEQPSEEAVQKAQADIDKITETLHNAEQMLADRDQQIAQLKETLATLNGIAEERDAAVQERNDISASLEKAGLDYAEQGKQLSDAEAKIAEHVAIIETFRKQVAELKAEVKELAGKPAPMTDGKAGVAQDNGTGDAPKVKQTPEQKITRSMSYAEVMKTMKGE